MISTSTHGQKFNSWQPGSEGHRYTKLGKRTEHTYIFMYITSIKHSHRCGTSGSPPLKLWDKRLSSDKNLKHGYLERQCPLMDELGSISKRTCTPQFSPRRSQRNTQHLSATSLLHRCGRSWGAIRRSWLCPLLHSQQKEISTYQMSHSWNHHVWVSFLRLPSQPNMNLPKMIHFQNLWVIYQLVRKSLCSSSLIGDFDLWPDLRRLGNSEYWEWFKWWVSALRINLTY